MAQFSKSGNLKELLVLRNMPGDAAEERAYTPIQAGLCNISYLHGIYMGHQPTVFLLRPGRRPASPLQ